MAQQLDNQINQIDLPTYTGDPPVQQERIKTQVSSHTVNQEAKRLLGHNSLGPQKSFSGIEKRYFP